MSINSHIAGMNTCDTTDTYFTTPSHTAPAARPLPSMSAGGTSMPWMSAGGTSMPWLMQGCSLYPNPSYAYPLSLPFSQRPFLPLLSPYQHRHRFFHCTSPQPQKQIQRTNKSFMIKDILGCTDSSSQTTQSTGEAQQSTGTQLQNIPSSMFSFYVLPTQKERFRQFGYSRTRTMFTQAQINELEKEFKLKKYLSTPERLELAQSLGLNPVTVKTWYQNKRMKWKKELQRVDPSCQPTRAKGRPPKSSIHNEDVEEQVIVD